MSAQHSYSWLGLTLKQCEEIEYITCYLQISLPSKPISKNWIANYVGSTMYAPFD